MRNALKMAGVSTGEIDYINAHSTSTGVGDAAELAGIGTLFANRGKDLMISSTKSATGHLMGAAGAIESVFSIEAMRHGMVPATLNLEDPDVGERFDLVPKVAKAKTLRHVLSNSFGFGGVECIAGVFGGLDAPSAPREARIAHRNGDADPSSALRAPSPARGKAITARVGL